MDVSFLPFYRSVYDCDESTSSHFGNIENTPIVKNKATAVGADITIWAYEGEELRPLRRGDRVSFPCSVHPQTSDSKDVSQFGLGCSRR